MDTIKKKHAAIDTIRNLSFNMENREILMELKSVIEMKELEFEKNVLDIETNRNKIMSLLQKLFDSDIHSREFEYYLYLYNRVATYFEYVFKRQFDNFDELKRNAVEMAFSGSAIVKIDTRSCQYSDDNKMFVQLYSQDCDTHTFVIVPKEFFLKRKNDIASAICENKDFLIEFNNELKFLKIKA